MFNAKISVMTVSIPAIAVQRRSFIGSSRTRLKGAWDQYCQLLETNPLLTKCSTSGIIAFAGDAISQLALVDNSSMTTFDVPRSIRYTTAGTFLVGISLHHWYSFLMRRIPGTALQSNIKRLTIDQLLFAPIFTATFISFLNIMEGKADLIFKKLQQDFVNIGTFNVSEFVTTHHTKENKGYILNVVHY